MKLSAKIIQKRMFDDLKKELKVFHKNREESFLADLRARIESGIIDPYDKSYKELCHSMSVEYIKGTSHAALEFVKNYVLEASDQLVDSQREGVYDKEETEIAFSVLKHMLIAAEMDVDELAKI